MPDYKRRCCCINISSKLLRDLPASAPDISLLRNFVVFLLWPLSRSCSSRERISFLGRSMLVREQIWRHGPFVLCHMILRLRGNQSQKFRPDGLYTSAHHAIAARGKRRALGFLNQRCS